MWGRSGQQWWSVLGKMELQEEQRDGWGSSSDPQMFSRLCTAAVRVRARVCVCVCVYVRTCVRTLTLMMSWNNQVPPPVSQDYLGT